MNGKVPPDPEPLTRTEAEGATVDLPGGVGGFAPGQVLGERYQVLELLGRGGMGEVWHAFDLKLRVEVALKALREDLFKSERRLEMLRDEVRAAREVVSPNVCRIFDLIEVEGRELVSMEYVDGATLLGVLQERGPLQLKEAQDIASQFLAGLEAIHKAGLIHRDIKPENIMLTRAGRVVVMDFGLARQEAEGGGSVSGTPAYMAPEQAAGQTLDARADVYAAGVVLAEMVSPEGIKSYQSRQSVWEGVRSEPAKLPDTPWAQVIQQAIKKDREGRFNSAHTLTRALEDVTLRVEGAEDLHPYPGLASFTESDAEYFFGREAEVEQMWRKLEGPPRMLGLVGPSGAGKTSFVQAGLFSTASAQWSTAICKPGSNPQLGLGRALAPAMAGDTGAMDLLLRFDDPDVAVEVLLRWRRQSDRALLVVDQFEELFTQNSSDVQQRFANLLERLVLEADVHVLISMRDDFMIRCRDFEALQPTFADLTALPTLSGAALRRALTQPALQCGYRFEDDELVDEMLAEVEGERGALPLLAFAAARLWEKRDRETGLLTRQAYQDIGGVGGALARHAEATIDRIGHERLPIVRELFRNLVTAEGTRAVREWGELLSVFERDEGLRAGINPAPTSGKRSRVTTVGEGFIPSREVAERVLRQLIDARLLTSYEVREEDQAPTRRVEIIHESLLANWPRLVRWQTQDQEGAQLRDELRQAARAWDEHDRHDDRLWTGTAFREYALWRERYPGGLTELEEAFASAMKSHAGRRRRRRQMIIGTAMVALLAVLAVVTGLWRQGVRQTRRAEAQKLIALGQLRMEDYPTASLSYATQSLELTDSEEARFLALQALWKGPTAFVVNETPTLFAKFSPGGNWLVQTHDFMSSLAIISRAGEQRVVKPPTESGKARWGLEFGGLEKTFFAHGAFEDRGHLTLWSAPEGRLLWSADMVDDPPGLVLFGTRGATAEDGQAVLAITKDLVSTVETVRTDGRHERLGSFRVKTPLASCMPSASAEWLGLVEATDISVITIGAESLSDRIPIGRHEGDRPDCVADPLGRYMLTFTRSGELRVWDVGGNHETRVFDVRRDLIDATISTDGSHILANTRSKEGGDCQVFSIDGSGLHLLRSVPDAGGAWGSVLDPTGLWLAKPGSTPFYRLWSLAAPAGAEPLLLGRGPVNYAHSLGFSPDGRWLATSDQSGLTMWALGRQYPAVIESAALPMGLNFDPNGRFLATAAISDLRVWPLEGPVPSGGHIVLETEQGVTTVLDVAVSPDGELFAVSSGGQTPPVRLLREGEEPQPLEGLEGLGPGSSCLAFSDDGRLVAASTETYDIKAHAIRVWEVASGDEVAVLRLDGAAFWGSRFTADGRLLTGSTKGVVAWDVETGEHETLVELGVQQFSANESGSRLLVTEVGVGDGFQDPAGSPYLFDLDTGNVTALTTHGSYVRVLALDRDGAVAVTGDSNGVVRVGPATGEEPHLLLGHDSRVLNVAIDPLGRWIASSSQDNTIRLWPMPDLSKPPLHTLPREELIAKLKTLTNVRVVRDPESATGWKLTHDPFPGWETVPSW